MLQLCKKNYRVLNLQLHSDLLPILVRSAAKFVGFLYGTISY